MFNMGVRLKLNEPKLQMIKIPSNSNLRESQRVKVGDRQAT
jgi:hypothetical protein